MHGIDEARRALRLRLHAHVEPHRRIEGHLLFDEQVRQFVAERIARRVGGEVAAFLAPAHNGVHHAADELSHRAFALFRARLAVKIFAGDDVRRRLRPALRHLDVFLTEDRHALFVSDQGGALLPFHRVERRNLSICKISFKRKAFVCCRSRIFRSRIRDRGIPSHCVFHCRHPVPPLLRAPTLRGGTP